MRFRLDRDRLGPGHEDPHKAPALPIMRTEHGEAVFQASGGELVQHGGVERRHAAHERASGSRPATRRAKLPSAMGSQSGRLSIS